MTLMSKPIHDPKLTRWWWRTLREWVYELVDPLWAAFRGDNSEEVVLANVTGINGVSAAELAVLDGVAVTTGELNKLAGLTAEAGELNKADRTAPDGQAEPSKNVLVDSNRDIVGKRYDINQSLLAAWAAKPALWFDGSNDKVDCGTGITDLPNGTTMLVLFKPATLSPSTFMTLVINSSGNDDRTGIQIDASGNITGGHWNGSAYTRKSGVLPSLDWHCVVLTYDGTAAQLFLDGLEQSGNAVPGLWGGNKLIFGINTDGAGHPFRGHIALVLVFNRVLSSDEIKAYSSGALPRYADTGASQTDLVTNGEDWTGASGSTPPNNWSDSGAGTATYLIRDNTSIANFGDNKALEINVSGGSKTLSQGAAQAGKRYRIRFVYRNLDGASSSYVALGSAVDPVTLQNTGISGDGVVFEQELLATGSDLMFFVDSGGTLQIDHVRVIQVGCLAAYLPQGIGHTQWQDNNSNNKHGVVVGAVPMNLPSNHTARNIENGITGDVTLTDVIPAGYRITGMVANVSGAGSGMILNVGTTAGGSDVVNGQDISANGLFDLAITKSIFSLSTAQTLYVNDDNGTAWSGVNVDLYMEVERVK